MNIQSTSRSTASRPAPSQREEALFKLGEAKLSNGDQVVKIDTNQNYGIDKRDAVLVMRDGDSWSAPASLDVLETVLGEKQLRVDDLRTWKEGGLFRRGDGIVQESELSEIFPKKVVYAPEWAKSEPKPDPRSESQITLSKGTGLLEFSWEGGREDSKPPVASKNRLDGLVAGAFVGGQLLGVLGAVVGGGMGSYMIGTMMEDVLMTGVIGFATGAMAGFAAGAVTGGAVGGAIGLATGAPRGSFLSEI